MQHGIEKEGLAFPSDSLNYYNGVLPDGEPDNIVFVNNVAWGGGDSLSMPITYVYGHDVYIHDWIFDRRDKSCTKPRVVAKILQHKIKMGRTEANNGRDEYSDVCTVSSGRSIITASTCRTKKPRQIWRS